MARFAKAGLIVGLVLTAEPSAAQLQQSFVVISTGNMNEPRHLHAAAVLPTGEVLVTGGLNLGGSGGSSTRYRASAELYQLAQGSFKLTDSMSLRRGMHTATTLRDGTVLIAGGISIKCSVCDGSMVASAELYDPLRKKFVPTGSMIAARAGHSATLLDDGRVLVAGGQDLNTFLSSAEVYDPVTGTFSPAGPMFSARAFTHTATRLQDGRVLIVGDFAPAEIYDPATNAFSPTGSLSHPRRGGHTATLLLDGKVLIAGGGGFAADNFSEIGQAELYDPVLGTFSPTVGALKAPRTNHGATRLATGHVLLAGGAAGSDILATMELYDPATGTFSLDGNIGIARAGHLQLQLDTGVVLLAGGADGQHEVTSTAELVYP